MRQRRGLTLFELLLVLALLVILGGLSMPALDGAFAKSRLRHAGDQIRSAWTSARLASLQSGQTHAFRCVWGERQFEVHSHAAIAAGEEPEIEPPDDRDDSPDNQWDDRHLAEGVTFTAGRWLSADAPGDEPPRFAEREVGEWSEPILFMADGTTSDASLILSNGRGDRLRVTLRGLTGVSLIGDVDPDEVVP